MNNLAVHLDIFPENSRKFLLSISADLGFVLKVTSKRESKLGDFRYPLKNQAPSISLNRDENTYRVLMTYLHELAHLIVFLEEGRTKNPHGPKWKKTYSHLLHMAYDADIFPQEIKEEVFSHILKPRASAFADAKLLKALRKFDPENGKIILDEIEPGGLFRLNNGRVFKKGEKRRTRILCLEVGGRRKYLIHHHAEVEAVNN